MVRAQLTGRPQAPAARDNHIDVGGVKRPAASVYTDSRPCSTPGCGRLVAQPPAGSRGMRPRLCGRCRAMRRALTFNKQAGRILEQLKNPDWQGDADG
jgi:hypothetical protein